MATNADTRSRPRPPLRVMPRYREEQPAAPQIEQKPAPNQAAPAKVQKDLYATQVIEPDKVAAIWRVIVWVFLLFSFLFSAVGNVRMFGGRVELLLVNDWPNWTYLISPAWLFAFAGALLSQFCIQIAQFRFAQERKDWKKYYTLVAFSVIPMLWTFWPLLTRIQAGYKVGYVWIIIPAIVLFGLNDMAQEWGLQKKKAPEQEAA